MLLSEKDAKNHAIKSLYAVSIFGHQVMCVHLRTNMKVCKKNSSSATACMVVRGAVKVDDVNENRYLQFISK